MKNWLGLFGILFIVIVGIFGGVFVGPSLFFAGVFVGCPILGVYAAINLANEYQQLPDTPEDLETQDNTKAGETIKFFLSLFAIICALIAGFLLYDFFSPIMQNLGLI